MLRFFLVSKESKLDFISDYGLFLAKALTIVFSVLLIMFFFFAANQRGKIGAEGRIEVKKLNESLDSLTDSLRAAILPSSAQKKERKRQKKERKIRAKGAEEAKVKAFVIDFKGDVQASAVTSLREEITAVLAVAEEGDEVLVRLESPGGVVHGYGLAASQLKRVRNKRIRLTVSVDKVAASGGYMMACIADNVIAAPFALLGSIGVVAQLPNFHRFLKKNDVDYELVTAGEYKRTLTIFGENTEKGREKFVEELEDVHVLFKDFVSENRPSVAIEEVATGEAWFGTRALERKLVDDLKTSDEYILELCDKRDVFHVQYIQDKSKLDRFFERLTRVWKSGYDQASNLPHNFIR